MKILLHNTAVADLLPTYGHRLDYQIDTLLHGFRCLFGSDCIDYPKMEHMYKGPQFVELRKDKCKGFTLYNRLQDIPIDRDDIDAKIQAHYFDLIVIGMHHSNAHDSELMLQTQARFTPYYQPNEIAVVDGFDGVDFVIPPSPDITYFKRELVTLLPGVYPIAFSIPEGNVLEEPTKKDMAFAPLIPSYLNQVAYKKTYIYEYEEDYNKDYQRSLFGLTWKKGGWDCLRHYEILANSCVPYFVDIDGCPKLTMFNFPKAICRIVHGLKGIDYQNMQISEDFDSTSYNILLYELLNYTKEYLTTKWMAQYLVEKVYENNGNIPNIS